MVSYDTGLSSCRRGDIALISPRCDVERVLADVREAIRLNKVILVPRGKNLRTLSQLGIKSVDAFDEINGLTYADYIKGPEKDHDPSELDDLWVFKTKVGGSVIYVKFKVEYHADGRLKVISFHLDGL